MSDYTPTRLLSRRVVAGMLLACVLVLAGCKRGSSRNVEVAYVSAPQVNLRDRVAAVYNKTGTARNGEKVEILEKSRRNFVRVKTARGEAGWMEQRYLVDADTYNGFLKLGKDNAGAIVQARGTTRASLNMHLAPGRDTEHLFQLRDQEKLEILRRTTAEKPQAPRPPAPRERAESVPKTRAAAKKETAPAPVPQLEDWLLVRDSERHTGWVLSRMVDVDAPLEIAQYAEGQRIVAYFVLDEATDADKKVAEYLVLLTEPRDGLPFDFNQARVFTWNLKRHRYETAYRERKLEGVFPARVGKEEFGKEGVLPTFTLPVRVEDGSVTERKYKLNGPIVRRVLSPEEQTKIKPTTPKAGSARSRRSR